MMKTIKNLMSIGLAGLFILSGSAMASGYVPIFSEIESFIYRLANPEPHGQAVLHSFWDGENSKKPLIVTQSIENKAIHLCVVRSFADNTNKSRLGFADSIQGPCYVTYANKTFVATQIEKANVQFYAPKPNSHNWSKPLKKPDDRHKHIALFSAENYADFVALCRVNKNGISYPGFILVTQSIKSFNKNVAAGKAICHFKMSITDNTVDQALAAEVLYWNSQISRY